MLSDNIHVETSNLLGITKQCERRLTHIHLSYKFQNSLKNNIKNMHASIVASDRFMIRPEHKFHE